MQDRERERQRIEEIAAELARDFAACGPAGPLAIAGKRIFDLEERTARLAREKQAIAQGAVDVVRAVAGVGPTTGIAVGALAAAMRSAGQDHGEVTLVALARQIEPEALDRPYEPVVGSGPPLPTFVREFRGKRATRAAHAFASRLAQVAEVAVVLGAKLVELGYRAPPDPEDYPSTLRAASVALGELVHHRAAAGERAKLAARGIAEGAARRMAPRSPPWRIRTVEDFIVALGDAVEGGNLPGVLGLDDEATFGGERRIAILLNDEPASRLNLSIRLAGTGDATTIAGGVLKAGAEPALRDAIREHAKDRQGFGTAEIAEAPAPPLARPSTIRALVERLDQWRGAHAELDDELSRVVAGETVDDALDRERRRRYQEGKAHGILHALDLVRELGRDGFELVQLGPLYDGNALRRRLVRGMAQLAAHPRTMLPKLAAWRADHGSFIDAARRAEAKRGPLLGPPPLDRALSWAIAAYVDLAVAPLAPDAGAELVVAQRMVDAADAALGDALGALARTVVETAGTSVALPGSSAPEV